MSIIEEALRRAQDPQAPKAQRPQPAVTEQQAPERQPTAHSWQAAPPSPTAPSTVFQTAPLTAVAVIVLILSVALVVGGAFWMGRTLATRPRAQTTSAPAAVAPGHGCAAGRCSWTAGCSGAGAGDGFAGGSSGSCTRRSASSIMLIASPSYETNTCPESS